MFRTSLMIGRVDIEESKTNIAMNAWLDKRQVISKIKQVWEGGSNYLPWCKFTKDQTLASLGYFP